MQKMNMKKRYLASCPISYRPLENKEQDRRNILSYIFSGYETCDTAVLQDACLQTDLSMSDWDDQYFEGLIERFTIDNDIGVSEPVDKFRDVIESGDEEYHSATGEKIEETHPDVPHSINIQLKDSPHIILEDGMHRTKISLTPNYLEQNGLELVIGEGPVRSIRLKTGDAEIYPSNKSLPPGIIVSVTDDKGGSGEKNGVVDEAYEDGINANGVDFQNRGKRMGLLSLVVDDLEERNIEALVEEKHQTHHHPGGNIIQCLSDYAYWKAADPTKADPKKKNQMSGRIHKAIAEMKKEKRVNPEISKLKQREMYKRMKKKFFQAELEGDPRLDIIKEKLIEELAKKGFETMTLEKFKHTEAQTDVHINPGSLDDFSFSDDSDSLLRRFYALRDVSGISSAEAELSKSKYFVNGNEKTADKNTHEATMGQIESDFSTRTEPTMEGISDLTDKNAIEEHQDDGIEKGDTTEDDVSDISTKNKEKAYSMTSIEMRSKLTDTRDLDDSGINDVAIRSDTELPPSLAKALRSFDEELNPLQIELNKLVSDFKSIEVPEEVQMSLATDRSSWAPPTDSQPRPDRPSSAVQFHSNPDLTGSVPPTSAHFRSNPETPIRQSTSSLFRRNPDDPSHANFRVNATPNRTGITAEPCHCPPGTCVGFRRSSGIICQRIQRLPYQATSAEFVREFTRPAWMNEGNRAQSILSDPEDIYGDRHQYPSSPRVNPNENANNRQNAP